MSRTSSSNAPITNRAAPQIVAAVDLGSNSFHMVVARDDHGELSVTDRLRVRVALAEGLDRRGQLSEEVSARALDCLRQFGQRLSDMSPQSVRAVGTNTLRQLKDEGQFLRQAGAALGHSIDIIEGHEEARLIYLGVAHSNADDYGRRLVIDIGGGSTECIIGQRFEPELGDSFFMGCVRFSLKFFADGKLTARRYERAVTAARLELRPVRRRYREVGWERCLGSSGTIMAISSILRRGDGDDGRITLGGLEQIRDQLLEAGHVDRIELAGLPEDRAPVLAGGLAILHGLFRSLHIEEMEPADGALREGLLYELLGRIQHEDVRDRTIRSFAERFHADRAQAKRVEATVLSLFEQARAGWQLNAETGRRLLRWAARLHEIGLAVRYSGHHRHGAYLVSHSDMPGFSRQEQHNLALLIGNHRRKLRPEPLTSPDGTDPDGLACLCGLLRVAVRLHRGRSSRPLPAIDVEATPGRLRLSFPPGWLDDHALSRAALGAEAAHLKALAIDLSVS